jgi:hypothetical protein
VGEPVIGQLSYWLRWKRHRCQRSFCAAEIRLLPVAVFGPVQRPPWLRQRPFG